MGHEVDFKTACYIFQAHVEFFFSSSKFPISNQQSTNCGAFHEGLKVEENGEELPDPWVG